MKQLKQRLFTPVELAFVAVFTLISTLALQFIKEKQRAKRKSIFAPFNGGFTLIELLVVLSIIATLVAILIPVIVNLVHR